MEKMRKRRRKRRAEISAVTAWSQLHDDLWRIIAEKLDTTAGKIRFRSVCQSWRSLLPPFPQLPRPPWLMLAEEVKTPNTRGFFSLGEFVETEEEDFQKLLKFVRLREEKPLEEIEEQDVYKFELQKVYQFELPEVYMTKSAGSTGMWLITVDLQERIRIVNPFSRLHFDLPSETTFQYEFERDYETDPENELVPEWFIWKVVLSSSPSCGRDCIAMAIYHYERRLTIARPGDASWTTVEIPELGWVDAIFSEGQFYAVNHYGELMVCDLGEDGKTPKGTMLTTERFREKNDREVIYLVEWMGELLLVIKFEHHRDNNFGYRADNFQIYIFDFENNKWWNEELEDLGEYSLFLGQNTSVAVAASEYPGMKENCIYFTDDYIHGRHATYQHMGWDMGVFDLEHKTIKHHYMGISTSPYSPPLWIIPQTR